MHRALLLSSFVIASCLTMFSLCNPGSCFVHQGMFGTVIIQFRDCVRSNHVLSAYSMSFFRITAVVFLKLLCQAFSVVLGAIGFHFGMQYWQVYICCCWFGRQPFWNAILETSEDVSTLGNVHRPSGNVWLARALAVLYYKKLPLLNNRFESLDHPAVSHLSSYDSIIATRPFFVLPFSVLFACLVGLPNRFKIVTINRTAASLLKLGTSRRLYNAWGLL